MKKFLIALLATILSLILVAVAFIGMYAGVPAFAEMVDYAVSSRNDDKMSAAEPPKNTIVEPVEVVTDEVSDEDVETELPSWEPVAEDYIVPPIEEQNIPDEVAEKSDLDPIQEYTTTVSDERADEIETTLSTGPTGDDLAFDPLFYPYYEMIGETSKRLYRQIYANVAEKNTAFRAVEKNVSLGDVQDAFIAVYYDHPELFWLDNEFYTYYRRNGDFLELDLVFNGTEGADGAFNDGLVALSPTPADAYDMEKSAHNAIAARDSYSLASPLNQSAYSAVVDDRTVCAGYARAFQLLCQQQGIPCYFCAGYAGEPHAWNIVCLDGEFYNVDVTWDDTDDARGNTYDWFNKTDADYGMTHIRQGLSVNLPACNGTKYGNLEENPVADFDLSQYGLSEGDVIYELSDYVSMMQNKLTSTGDYTFYSLVGSDLAETLFRTGDTRISDEFMRPIMEAVGGTQCSYSFEPTELPNGMCLVENRISIR